MSSMSNIRAHVSLNLLNYIFCEKEMKCSVSLAFHLFSPTCLINSIKHEHSRKIFYFKSYRELSLSTHFVGRQITKDYHAQVNKYLNHMVVVKKSR